MRSGWIPTRNVARISVRNCTHISTTNGTGSLPLADGQKTTQSLSALRSARNRRDSAVLEAIARVRPIIPKLRDCAKHWDLAIRYRSRGSVLPGGAHYIALTSWMCVVSSSLGLASRGLSPIIPCCRRQDEFRTARRTEPNSHSLRSPEVNGFGINPTGLGRGLKPHPESLTGCDEAVGEDHGAPSADVQKPCPCESLSSRVQNLYIRLVGRWRMSSRSSAIDGKRHGSSSLRVCAGGVSSNSRTAHNDRTHFERAGWSVSD